MKDFFYFCYEPLLKLENADPYLTVFVYMFIVFCGLAIGSFLNVCIYRIPINESIVGKNPSHCRTCGAKIKARDNIPLFGWLLLKGRCRSCGEKISSRYPIVEGLNCLIYIITFTILDVNPKSILYCFFFSTLIVIGFIDWDTQEIAIFLLGFIFFLDILAILLVKDAQLVYINDVISPEISLLNRIIGAFCISVPFYIIGELSGLYIKQQKGEYVRGIELGDTFLMFVSGLMLGWKLTVFAGFLGIILAAVCGIIYKAVTKESKFAFGPFLAVALFISALWGNDLIDWYVNKFLVFPE
ncbi:MAG: prepilin peptidase [Oscillospiraceae bacterium]|nr:prepilin peptidase [Oscillospiraceae bacterium]